MSALAVLMLLGDTVATLRLRLSDGRREIIVPVMQGSPTILLTSDLHAQKLDVSHGLAAIPGTTERRDALAVLSGSPL